MKPLQALALTLLLVSCAPVPEDVRLPAAEEAPAPSDGGQGRRAFSCQGGELWGVQIDYTADARGSETAESALRSALEPYAARLDGAVATDRAWGGVVVQDGRVLVVAVARQEPADSTWLTDQVRGCSSDVQPIG